VEGKRDEGKTAIKQRSELKREWRRPLTSKRKGEICGKVETFRREKKKGTPGMPKQGRGVPGKNRKKYEGKALLKGRTRGNTGGGPRA